MTHRLRFALPATLALLCAACAAPGGAPFPAAPDAGSDPRLADVRRAYDAGEFGTVIREVATSPELDAAPDAVRVQAYKLQAFSYCMTGYTGLCRDTFRRIMALAPGFELSPAEAGHPQWGPEYEAARRGVR